MAKKQSTRDQISALRAENEELHEDNAELDKQIAKLEQDLRIAGERLLQECLRIRMEERERAKKLVDDAKANSTWDSRHDRLYSEMQEIDRLIKLALGDGLTPLEGVRRLCLERRA